MQSKFIYSLLILILPWSVFGQGWVKWSSDTIDHLDPSIIEDLDQIYSPTGMAFISESYLNDELLLLNHKGINKFDIPKSIQIDANGSAVFGSDLLVRCKSGIINSYKIQSEGLTPWKSQQAPLKWKSSYLSCTYAFTDENFAYFFCYYNNNLKGNRAWDYLYAIKYDPIKNRIVKSKTFDLGKDILLAPLSHQQLAYNQNGFFFVSSLGHELTVIDKDFKLLDSRYIDKELYNYNNNILDSIISDKAAPYYLHKPSDLIYHYSNSELKELVAMQKVLSLNDSTLLYVKRLSFRDQFELGLLSINDNSYAILDSFSHSKHSFSPLSWSRNVYSNLEYQFPLIHLARMPDSSYKYVIHVWKWYQNKSILSSSLPSIIQELFSSDAKYRAVLLASPTFCKACYNQMGVGEGVLVIKPIKNKELQKLRRTQLKRYLNIKGELIFIDQGTYDALKQMLQPDIIYPVKGGLQVQ